MDSDFLGVGWTFPVRLVVDNDKRQIELARYEEAVSQSIRMILQQISFKPATSMVR